MHLRENSSSIVNHVTIRVTENLWNLMPPNNIWDEKDFRGNRTHLFAKRKGSSATAMEKSDTSSKIADSNNSNHSNVFREPYRWLRKTSIGICNDQICRRYHRRAYLRSYQIRILWKRLITLWNYWILVVTRTHQLMRGRPESCSRWKSTTWSVYRMGEVWTSTCPKQ